MTAADLSPLVRAILAVEGRAGLIDTGFVDQKTAGNIWTFGGETWQIRVAVWRVFPRRHYGLANFIRDLGADPAEIEAREKAERAALEEEAWEANRRKAAEAVAEIVATWSAHRRLAFQGYLDEHTPTSQTEALP